MNPSTALAGVLVDELVRQGVRDAVLCPGSRSAPFAYALQRADREGRMRLHVRVDERSAGFLALGLAKVSGRPVPVLTTSGTAVANLHPAVLEASHAGVPLLVLSADRPPELQGTGANQTTNQTHLFGMATRWFHDLGAPDRRAGQNARWRSVVSRACAVAVGATGGDAGPVHLNAPLREPLVPDLDDEPWPDELTGRDGGRPWVQVRHAAQAAAPTTLTVRTLVVLGDLPRPEMAADVVAMAARRGWPVVAEPFGAPDRQQVIPHGPLLLTAAKWLSEHRPDRVLVVGRVTLSRVVAGLLRHPDVAVELIAPGTHWSDPPHRASVVHPWGAVAATSGPSGPSGRMPRTDDSSPWLAQWQDAGARIAKAVDPVVADSWPSGLGVASTLLARVPAGSTLFTGSSNSVRDLDLAMAPEKVAADLAVVASRGLAGIDGSVSTAVGVALSEPDRPSYALMGDLTFLHDTNGLLIGPREPRADLTIVVVNDDGGGIFTLLEPGDPVRAHDFERIFGTATGARVIDICRAHGVRHTLAETRHALAEAVAARPQGIHVVEVAIDRSAHRGWHESLRAAAATALA